MIQHCSIPTRSNELTRQTNDSGCVLERYNSPSCQDERDEIPYVSKECNSDNLTMTSKYYDIDCIEGKVFTYVFANDNCNGTGSITSILQLGACASFFQGDNTSERWVCPIGSGCNPDENNNNDALRYSAFWMVF